MNLNVKKLIPVLYAVAGVCLLGGILLLFLAVPNAASAFFTVMFVILAILCILLAGCIVYYIHLSSDNDANFFLYDRKTGANSSPEELTFDRINSRMGYYMTVISSSQEEMWKKDILGRTDDHFGYNEVYKPLVAYKMLYDLIELDRPETWELFTSADSTVIETLCDVLSVVGDEAMSGTLKQAYENAADVSDTEWLRDFLTGNAKYIRRRMMDYIQKNLEWFY